MFLSDTEIDAQLAVLRRQRDLIERKIADLLLFRELGRRLTGSASPEQVPRSASGDAADEDVTGRLDDPAATLAPSREQAWTDRGSESASLDDRDLGGPSRTERVPRAGDGSERRPAKAAGEHRSPPVPAVSFEEDPVAARRYGRALLDAVIEVLGEVGRPLHAGELLERVVARGFTVPGQDPVAALNTRLWKRSGPGKPLRRLGEAVYALSEPPAA